MNKTIQCSNAYCRAVFPKKTTIGETEGCRICGARLNEVGYKELWLNQKPRQMGTRKNKKDTGNETQEQS